ncbi:MAG: zinc ribbon domain-containing protein [Dehalococcoidia bacterium]
MPTYDFHCPQCGSEFEVSRPVSRMEEPVFCPADGARAKRLLAFNAATFGLGRRSGDAEDMPMPPAAPTSGGWSHFGHSHGIGDSGHSHDFSDELPDP